MPPWDKYQAAAPITSAPKVNVGTGFRQTGPASAAPIVGGPEDPATIARNQGIKTGIDTAAQERLIALRTQAGIEEARRKWEMENGPKPVIPLTPKQLQAGRIDALDKINAARDARNLSRNGWFATGFGAPTMSNIGGTPAKTVMAKTDKLKAAGALRDIIEMSQANGGKNPLTPMSGSDVEVIARNKANLDIGQNDESFQGEVGLVEDAYRRAFQAVGGNLGDLEKALEWRRREQAKLEGKKVGSTVRKYDAQGNPVR